MAGSLDPCECDDNSMTKMPTRRSMRVRLKPNRPPKEIRRVHIDNFCSSAELRPYNEKRFQSGLRVSANHFASNHSSRRQSRAETPTIYSTKGWRLDSRADSDDQCGFDHRAIYCSPLHCNKSVTRYTDSDSPFQNLKLSEANGQQETI